MQHMCTFTVIEDFFFLIELDLNSFARLTKSTEDYPKQLMADYFIVVRMRATYWNY